MDHKKKLLIVAHAPSPNTLTLREAVAQGAGHEDVEDVEVTVLALLDAGPVKSIYNSHNGGGACPNQQRQADQKGNENQPCYITGAG